MKNMMVRSMLQKDIGLGNEMSYEQLRYKITNFKVNGVDVPMTQKHSIRDSLEIMFNLDMVEKELVKSDLAEAKTVLQKFTGK